MENNCIDMFYSMEKKAKGKARCRGQAPTLNGTLKRHMPLVDLLLLHKMMVT